MYAIDMLRQQLRATGGRPLIGHKQPTRVAAFSRDRRWLATGSDDGTIRLWDLDNADPTSRSSLLNGAGGQVHGLAFSPDGAWLVSGGEDGTVRLWRLTGEGASSGPTFRRPEYGAIHAVAICPNGRWLIFGTQSGNVCMWELSAEGPLKTPREISKEQDPGQERRVQSQGALACDYLYGSLRNFGASVSLWDLAADFPIRKPERLSHATELGEDSLLAIAFNGEADATGGCVRLITPRFGI